MNILDLDWRHWVFILGICALVVSNSYWKDMYDKKDTFCESRVAAAVARMHPSNATMILLPKEMQYCVPSTYGAEYGYNCWNATENLTFVVEVYSK